ncbi:metal ABC transporter substrate-binding protein [Dehalobacterium formicoaceticum]|uniref:Metal ABC transporter substrate-binding protein n=1 Tax=Dehalobacterium formicoaceticum TaxID=51515 RepID=A0ABT1XZP0_9FIRM|nr:metal ABC transporter substrate-binding protein [Dehalobacterium formicoaceticum]MCR6544082.1 metal ABC transporter substrate-binding protein [Dehalobacterium formicoaceticum]
MKRKIAGMLLIVTLLILTGCAGGNEGTPVQSNQDEEGTPLKIVTSFYPMYIMALNITDGIPGVEVVNLTEPTTGCLHDYQLTPGDMVNLQDAQIMIVNGAGMESFLDKITENSSNMKMIDASKGLELLQNETDGESNPHLWVSISGAISQTKNIGQQLAESDPDRAALYLANTETYIEKLEQLRTKMHQTIDPLDNRDIVTFHEAFPYFAREFDLNIQAVIQREPGSEPSPGELTDTIQVVKASGAKVLFAEPQYGDTAAETIARETGAQLYYLDPAVTGPADKDAYLQIMEDNLQVLGEALQ